jgi:hypothetical protein
MSLKGLLMATWMLAIPLSGLVALFLWFRRLRGDLPWWRSVVGVLAICTAVANWLWFLWLAKSGEIGGFGTHYMTTRSASRYSLIALGTIGASLALKSRSRAFAVASSGLLFALWGGSQMVA